MPVTLRSTSATRPSNIVKSNRHLHSVWYISAQSPPSPQTNLLHERQKQASESAESDHSPSRNLDLLVRNAPSQIPHQMPEPVEAVESKREADDQLRQELGRHGPGRERGRQGRALQVPSQNRCHQVCGSEDVEPAAQHAPGDAVEGGSVPGDLRTVDAEVRGDGAVQTLLCEDLVGGFVGVDGLGGCESVGEGAMSAGCILRLVAHREEEGKGGVGPSLLRDRARGDGCWDMAGLPGGHCLGASVVPLRAVGGRLELTAAQRLRSDPLGEHCGGVRSYWRYSNSCIDGTTTPRLDGWRLAEVAVTIPRS